MLLHEIVSGENIRRAGRIDVSTKVRNTRSLQRTGSGRQGVVVNRRTKINMVTKIFGFNDENDAYFQFVKMIGEHQDNPYFPRVANLRLYKKEFRSTWDDIYSNMGVIDMERLIPLSNPKIREAVSHKLAALGISSIKSLDVDSIYLTYKRALAGGRIDSDPLFEEAMELILTIAPISDLDLHSKNIMVRLTSVGPQLVLIDPLWDPER